MHRWVSALFLLCVAAAVVALVLGRAQEPRAAPATSADGAAVLQLDTSAPLVPSLTLTALPSESLDPGAPREPCKGDLPTMPKENPGAGATLVDGSEPPPLPKSAPAQVRFGAFLVTYRGAEQADAQTRTREQALEHARKLAEAAQTDFVEAGKRADVFLVDAGAITQGYLEPAPQHVLFNLEVGAVGGPVDSPRGFYVFKRLE